MTRFGAVFCLLMLPMIAAAGIYRWLDRNGQVHYTQVPPPGGAFESVAPAPPPGVNTQQDGLRKFIEELSRAEAAEQKAKAEESAKKAENAQRCTEAHDRLAFLEGRPMHYLMIQNADGSYSRMTAEEWNKRREEARAQIKETCE